MEMGNRENDELRHHVVIPVIYVGVCKVRGMFSLASTDVESTKKSCFILPMVH